MRKNMTLTASLVLLVFTFVSVPAAFAGGLDANISVFVDASFVYDDNGDSNTFSLDQVEVDVEKDLGERASLRADIEFLDLGGDEDVNLEQGFMMVKDIAGSSVDLTFGKFNAPIGFELLDAPDMYQFSHALVFENGIPTNAVGLMVSSSLGSMVDIKLYGVNGWDLDSDNNREKTYGGRLGIVPIEGLSLGISGIYGAEKDDNNSDIRGVIDLDAELTFIENLIIGFEANFGNEDKAALDGDDAKWSGYLLMAHYDFLEWLGITFRYDYFDDADGSRTGAEQKLSAVTAAATFTIDDGAGALIEYRYDTSDEDTFLRADGGMTDSNSTAAVEFTYSF